MEFGGTDTQIQRAVAGPCQLHDNGWLRHTIADGLVREDARAVQVQFILYSHILAKHGDALDAHLF